MEPKELPVYFGTESEPECHMLYGVSSMVNLWAALATRDTRMLKHQMDVIHSLPKNCYFVNYLGLIARLKEQAGIHSQVVGYVLDAVADAIHLDDDMQIYTSGATNIFKYPELSDNQSAQEIISAFEEKQQLSELVTQTLAKEDNTGIQVYIGDETPVQTMRDCSVVTG